MRKKEYHGMCATREYRSWRSMITRCTCPNNDSFPNYGGRGITVCQEWLDSFSAFFAHIGPRPAGTSLDRIENSLGYFPGNVKWSTRREQNRNYRRNHPLTVNGETRLMIDWSRLLGIRWSTLAQRVASGFPPEQCVSTGRLPWGSRPSSRFSR